MALSITNFSRYASDSFGGPVPAPLMNGAQTEQAVEIDVTSNRSDPVSSSAVMIHSPVTAYLAFGDVTVEAVVGLHQIGAGETRFYGVTPGSYIAVIGE